MTLNVKTEKYELCRNQLETETLHQCASLTDLAENVCLVNRFTVSFISRNIFLYKFSFKPALRNIETCFQFLLQQPESGLLFDDNKFAGIYIGQGKYCAKQFTFLKSNVILSINEKPKSKL